MCLIWYLYTVQASGDHDQLDFIWNAMGAGLCVLISPSLQLIASIWLIYWDLYFVSFPKDRLLIKWIVSIQLLLQAIQTAMLTHGAFIAFSIISFFQNTILNNIGTLWCSIALMTGFSTSIHVLCHFEKIADHFIRQLRVSQKGSIVIEFAHLHIQNGQWLQSAW